jgi:hypothetical protein
MDFAAVLQADNASPVWGLGPFQRSTDGNPVIKPDPQATFNCPMRESIPPNTKSRNHSLIVKT